MLLSFALIFLLGMALGKILEKLGLPQLLGMLLTGILLGPYGLSLLDPELLAVMAMGATLQQGNYEAARRLSGKFSKLWVGAEVLLFVLVGASVNVGYAAQGGLLAILLLLGVLVFRLAGVFLSLVKTPLSGKERLFAAMAYLPKATVQAAIGGLPLAMGLASGELILAVAVTSIFLTAPLGALLVDHLKVRLLGAPEGSA